MLYFEEPFLRVWLRSFGKLIALAFSFLVIISVLGGINADIPGVSDDPAAQGAISFFALCLRIALHIIWNYPVYVLIGVVAVAFFHAVAVRKPIGNRRRAYNKRREAISRKLKERQQNSGSRKTPK